MAILMIMPLYFLLEFMHTCAIFNINLVYPSIEFFFSKLIG
ncbi:hypothetical protein FHX64_001145 [Microbacter margulisiae]|uniref:Uncharacterized protein n=1 Tax=Microbacter margulisiae TaxID=1350067 RepID=A0A7W5DQ70_9PORP|nr:hypothetical protein [Microbacter margulisiae]